MSPRSLMFTTSILSTLVLGSPVRAQDCIGLPSGSAGSATYGVVGTDGASGDEIAISAWASRAGFEFERSRLGMFAYSDDMTIWSATGSWQLSEMARWACVTAGLEWSGYSADRHSSTGWDGSGDRTEFHEIVGDYARLRIPVGLALGHEFSPEGAFGIIPFAAAALVYERERLKSTGEFGAPEGIDEGRAGAAIGARAGATLRFHRILLSSDVGHVFGEDRALSGRNNFPFASLRIGFTF